MFRIITDYLYSFLSIVAAIVTILLFWEQISKSVGGDARLAIFLITALFLWHFFENLYLKVRWGRERKYAQALAYVSDGFSEVHNLGRQQAVSIEAVKRACERLCDSLAKTFSLITGTKCNASIKILIEDVDENNHSKLRAVTFSRSTDMMRNPKRNFIKHWLDQNTDFLMIFDSIDKPARANFFSNSLPIRFGYNNTSFKMYRGDPPDNNLVLRYWRWPLPYKSTIVVPICPSSEQSKKTLIGFLCVDSERVGAFSPSYDITLLSGVADGIYNLLARESEQLSEAAKNL